MNSNDVAVTVELGPRSYEIQISAGCLTTAGTTIRRWLRRDPGQSLKCLIVTDSNVLQPHANAVRDSLQREGATSSVVCVNPGEASKSLQEASELYDALVEMKADRKTVVVAVGGGVIGDLAGFVAATYARGIPFVQVPTTLLAMVDSSVGGKTGVNHPKGKNLIGAFHQPSGVLADTEVFKTLPQREYTSGLAEVIKYGVILDADFFDWLECSIDGLNNRDEAVLQHVVARSCELKALVVKEDEFETTGLRAILNYGHTYAHAFEALAGYGTLLHGEAVSIGMICASRLANRLGRISSHLTERQAKLLQAVGLPIAVPETLKSRKDEILNCMMLDKKTEAGNLRFILPDKLGHVETVTGIDSGTVLECLNS
ncbi:MAG: 3-dehydroquinate synthase [Planctomycetaceae bacterium]|nr:3-dehydroquinate synthase [Planctomycetaceae bacterium]